MFALYLAKACFKPATADGEDLNTYFTFTPLSFSHFIKDCFPYVGITVAVWENADLQKKKKKKSRLPR